MSLSCNSWEKCNDNAGSDNYNVHVQDHIESRNETKLNNLATVCSFITIFIS